jgi:N-acetyl sugar amidotransferase
MTFSPPQRNLSSPRGEYGICARCIMDTGDPEIRFDEKGVCNHCHTYDQVIARYVVKGERGERELEAIAAGVRAKGAGKRYDCIVGLSGGADSTYVAWLARRKLGLRPLAVHLDNGWNSETAVRNIENIVRRLDIDLYTEVLDWEEFRSLQLAFLRASTPDCEIPTDHAIVGALYRAAVRNGVGFIINGSNYATEQMVPRTWSYGHFDWRYLSAVNRRFGDRPLRTFPRLSLFNLKVGYPILRRIQQVYPLNYLEYDKAEARRIVERELGWQDYGGKHHESIYTRFYQAWLLPKKFGVDKRRSHLSCLVNCGKLSRDAALAEMARPAADPAQLEIDRRFVIKKLGLTEAQFDEIVKAPLRSFWDFPSYDLDPPLWDRAMTRAIAAIASGNPLLYPLRLLGRWLLRR